MNSESFRFRARAMDRGSELATRENIIIAATIHVVYESERRNYATAVPAHNSTVPIDLGMPDSDTNQDWTTGQVSRAADPTTSSVDEYS